MSEVTHEDAAPQSLSDPWDRTGRVPLDGPLERAHLHPALPALFWPFLAMGLFFLVSSIALAVVVVAGGADLETLEFSVLVEEYTSSILISNTVGQVLALALPVVILMLLHSSRPSAFVRFRTPRLDMLGMAMLGWLALIPVVGWLGEINQQVPVPEFFRMMEEQQMAFLEEVLVGELGIVFTLLMVAITPAICEELLFRGYIQRQAERAFGVMLGVAFAGIVFGLFHLRPSQALPLMALGLYLAYLAWRTGSLWIPIAVHFANNAYALVLGMSYQHRGIEWATYEQMTLPWYLVVLGALLFVGIVALLHVRAREVLRSTGVPKT